MLSARIRLPPWMVISQMMIHPTSTTNKFRRSTIRIFLVGCFVGTLGYFRIITILFQTTTTTTTSTRIQDINEHVSPLVLSPSGLEKTTFTTKGNSLPDLWQRSDRVVSSNILQQQKQQQRDSRLLPPQQQQRPWMMDMTTKTTLRKKRRPKNHEDTFIDGFGSQQRSIRKNPMSHTSRNSSMTAFGSSLIYQRGPWDGAPIVIESHHLIFFTIPKIGCTVFKMLFRRMMHYPDWWSAEEKDKNGTVVDNSDRIHDPDLNGLSYLYDYPEHTAQSMLKSRNWTKAVFVRDPKTRLLSAYLDKAINTDYMLRHCCRHFQLKRVLPCRRQQGFVSRNITFAEFVYHVIPICRDPHWEAQANRIPPEYWPHIDFIGHMESIATDTKRLLERIGAWDAYGATGWQGGGGSIFAGTAVSHATDSSARLREYYKSELETAVEDFYKMDYEHPLLNLTRFQIFPK
jgi:hypothetical protein